MLFDYLIVLPFKSGGDPTDIFVDSGIVFGFAWVDDKEWHIDCMRLIEMFPFEENNYHSTKDILKKEINNLGRIRIGERERVIRRINDRAKIFCEHMKHVAYPNHESFQSLFGDILSLLISRGEQFKVFNNDAIFLSNAHIWDNENDLVTPHFITTDKIDIYDNRDEIHAAVNSCLKCNSTLNIEYVRNFFT